MQYPLDLSFKILSLASQLSVTDATGQLQFYVRQQLFKLKEAITVYADAEQTRPLFYINADRVLDISAQYTFTDTHGRTLGAIKRQGMRSFIKAHYDILYGEMPVMTVREEKGWIKVADAVLNMVPYLGFFTGFFLHPAYIVERPDSTVVMRFEKQPAFFEGKFKIESHASLEGNEETLVLLSVLLVVLLERGRG